MRTAAAFLLLASLLAAPWAACVWLGWDAAVEVIGGTLPPTGAHLVQAATAVVARMIALLLAPIPAIAAVVRVAAPALARWTAASRARTLQA